MKIFIVIPIAILLAKMRGAKNKKINLLNQIEEEHCRIIHPAEFNVRW